MLNRFCGRAVGGWWWLGWWFLTCWSLPSLDSTLWLPEAEAQCLPGTGWEEGLRLSFRKPGSSHSLGANVTSLEQRPGAGSHAPGAESQSPAVFLGPLMRLPTLSQLMCFLVT